jgi:hypothetical protein
MTPFLTAQSSRSPLRAKRGDSGIDLVGAGGSNPRPYGCELGCARLPPYTSRTAGSCSHEVNSCEVPGRTEVGPQHSSLAIYVGSTPIPVIGFY